jgi:hypothetical protein
MKTIENSFDCNDSNKYTNGNPEKIYSAFVIGIEVGMKIWNKSFNCGHPLPPHDCSNSKITMVWKE